MVSTESDETGLRPTEDDIQFVVAAAYQNPFTVSSNFARSEAPEVAAASSMGYITTMESPGLYGRRWRATPTGIHFIHKEQKTS